MPVPVLGLLAVAAEVPGGGAAEEAVGEAVGEAKAALCMDSGGRRRGQKPMQRKVRRKKWAAVSAFSPQVPLAALDLG